VASNVSIVTLKEHVLRSIAPSIVNFQTSVHVQSNVDLVFRHVTSLSMQMTRVFNVQKVNLSMCLKEHARSNHVLRIAK